MIVFRRAVANRFCRTLASVVSEMYLVYVTPMQSVLRSKSSMRVIEKANGADRVRTEPLMGCTIGRLLAFTGRSSQGPTLGAAVGAT